MESNDLVYLWEGGRAFVTRFNQLSPEQRELVNVKTKRGVTRALLFSKAILREEFATDAPLREAMAIKRQRVQGLRRERAAKRAARAARKRRPRRPKGQGLPPNG